MHNRVEVYFCRYVFDNNISLNGNFLTTFVVPTAKTLISEIYLGQVAKSYEANEYT